MRNPRLKTSRKIDVYALYEEAVQDPKTDVVFYDQLFRDLHDRTARRFREDFCGTFKICCEWVKLHPGNRSVGVDLDAEPLGYGRRRHLARLRPAQRRRVTLLQKNVLEVERPKSDITVACNFSYFTFKKRAQLKRYFRAAYRALASPGLFLVDTTGGSEFHESNLEWRLYRTKAGRHKFSYFWDQKTYNPITMESEFAIHFKMPDGTRIRDAFIYDWRLWSIPELREVMAEAGFRKTMVYWEGDDSKGGGNGDFKPVETAEGCESWLAYVVGIKE